MCALSGDVERVAFYALRPGGARDVITLLHPPYTAWHLSYVALGAGLAEHTDGARLAWTLAAFLLAVGIAAHCLDELNGRPLDTHLPPRVLALGGRRLARRRRRDRPLGRELDRRLPAAVRAHRRRHS